MVLCEAGFYAPYNYKFSFMCCRTQNGSHGATWVTRCNMGHTLQHVSHVATWVIRCNMGHTLQHGSSHTRCNMGHTLQHESHPRDTVLQDTLCFTARKGRGVCYGSGCSIWVTYVTTWVTPARYCVAGHAVLHS